MTSEAGSQKEGGGDLPVYRAVARNTSAGSENKIHDDRIAASYGFRGGLVPGVSVYGYVTAPLVERFGMSWLERGSMQIKFHRPFYEGETVFVRGEVGGGSDTLKVSLRAERADGTVCATARAAVGDRSSGLGEPRMEDYPPSPLPPENSRPVASGELFAGRPALGTLREELDLRSAETGLLANLGKSLPAYYGSQAVAHPALLLGLANQVFVRNFRLGPWIHAASDLINWSTARDGEVISVRGLISECFERKGHEFVVLDLLLVAAEERVVQQVRHTAIYRPRQSEGATRALGFQPPD